MLNKKDLIVVVVWTMTFVALAALFEVANVEVNFSTVCSIVAFTIASVAFVKNVVYKR